MLVCLIFLIIRYFKKKQTTGISILKVSNVSNYQPFMIQVWKIKLNV